jgi:hypothetical protein
MIPVDGQICRKDEGGGLGNAGKWTNWRANGEDEAAIGQLLIFRVYKARVLLIYHRCHRPQINVESGGYAR